MTMTDKTKVNISKTALLAFLVLFIAMGYGMIRYADYRVKNNLIEMLTPIASECSTNAGCPSVPSGWVERACPTWSVLPQVSVCASPPEASTYKGLVYKADSAEFFIHWSYVSDAYFEVHGGRGLEMRVQEFPIETSTQTKE